MSFQLLCAIQKIKVFLVDDHKLLTSSFESMLNAEIDFEVIGCAANGHELLTALKTVTPDVIVLDIEMPVMDGRRTLEILQIYHPFIPVIILSMTYEIAVIQQFLEMGAKAYLKKNCDIDEFMTTIRNVHQRKYRFNNEIISTITQSIQNKFTSAELVVLKMMCDEYTSPKIAETLNISLNTVEFHRKSIFKKMGVKTVVGALKEALREGLTKL
jgi:DNA-binding NarL/FixJ family response regulator